MRCFTYSKSEKREQLSLDEAQNTLDKLAEYLVREHKKGKIPIIIAGAGISTCHLEAWERIQKENGAEEFNRIQYEKGLPSLGGMVKKIRILVESASPGSAELDKVKELFREVETQPDYDEFMDRVDREWIGKLFGALSDSRDKSVYDVWRQFCQWFFFGCCNVEGGDKTPGGALNISTSQAAWEIAKLYASLDAICLSANFDDFLEFALTGTNGGHLGISLFTKRHVDGYFRRNRRGEKEFSTPPHNHCVLHANGDVLWLHCSGDQDEGYCPQRGKYFPAFCDRRHTNEKDLLQCRICGSTMDPTMTMPGTYQKDYNTRQIISSIWEHLAPKISCVITVGLSCNWDDVLLKFILGLLAEREIPHLDINNLSDPIHDGETEIVRQIVRERRFQSCGIQADAKDGLKRLNESISNVKDIPSFYEQTEATQEMPPFFDDLVKMLEQYEEIQHLMRVSQLGLKALSVERRVENDRWEHSKEVAQIAYRLYHRLCKNSRKKESPFEQALLCTAGLLHDCGHLPFSHLLEDVFEELSWGISENGDSFRHNQYSKLLIYHMCAKEGSPLKTFLDQYGVMPEEVVQLIEGSYGIGYLDTLINSAVDADKIAYIFTDAEQMRRGLMLKRDEFIDKLTEKAYITQEGLVALDSTSAWYAMRLLDERKRMYDELYLDPHMRCMEAAAKYIITTYFVQKYNQAEFEDRLMESENISDLGGYRIMLAIKDMIQMETGKDDLVGALSASVGSRTKESLKYCMEIIQKLIVHGGRGELKEWALLKQMYERLTGQEWQEAEKQDPEALTPYQDDQIQDMADKLTYQKLADVRKRIILNYPGMVLIDLYKPIRYYSTPVIRRPHYRLDGTKCAQDTILLPDSKRSQWQDKECKATISLSEYVSRYEKGADQKPIFQVFKIRDSQVECEHVINILKKEMQNQLQKGGNTP